MDWGIISLTKNGLKLSYKIKKEFPDSDVYSLPKWDDGDFFKINNDFSEFVGDVFYKYKILIFIMATGIVVRTISKYLKDKTTDPGIIVIDEKGEFVISLLSGHIGGANEVAKIIANKINATPVITTSSDVNDKIPVDMFAKKNKLIIDNMQNAKIVTSMIVNNEPVSTISDYQIDIPDYLNCEEKSSKGNVFITNKIIDKNIKPFVQLIPQNITIGIGCKKGIESPKLISFVEGKLNSLKLDKRSIKYISSIDIKKEEKAIIDTAKYFNCNLVFFDKKGIQEIENKFNKSEFVEKSIGVGSVCEPTAFLAGNKNGKFLQKKDTFEGMTIAIFEEEVLYPRNY